MVRFSWPSVVLAVLLSLSAGCQSEEVPCPGCEPTTGSSATTGPGGTAPASTTGMSPTQATSADPGANRGGAAGVGPTQMVPAGQMASGPQVPQAGRMGPNMQAAPPGQMDLDPAQMLPDEDEDNPVMDEPEWEPEYWPTMGWETRTPEELDYDSALLEEAVAFATATSTTQALLVIQDGYIISEGYFAGFGMDERHESFSMAKSFTSGLVGIAIGEGLIADGVGSRICEYYEEWNCDDANDARSRITLEHLLTLTSGLEWTEDWSSAANIISNEAARLGNNPTPYVLGKPSEHEPGTSFQYSTGDPALITGVLQTATGKTALAYAEEKVLDPIGITTLTWNSDRDGRTTTFAGIQATARDYARYGFLFLNRGRWDGQELVPPDWVDVSTQPGKSLQPWYGYLWHVDLAVKFEDSELPSDGYTAMGIQGQLITVIPSERLVVVRLARDAIGTDAFDEAGLYTRILAAKQ